MNQEHQRLAESVVATLQDAGFTALFAGGWVRDFVMGKPCQDIDIATDAHPEQVMALFSRSIGVGAQFGVVRVLLHGHEFEVATFRSDAQYVDGRRPSHVDLHASPEEDAKRRDFTINGMFYDPISHELYDYVGGREDIDAKRIRTIGRPEDRFKEDRLRMIRAIRFKNVLSFSIEQATWDAVCRECRHVAAAVSPERVWQELLKMFEKHVLPSCLQDMASCGLLTTLFPILKHTPHYVMLERIATVKRYTGTALAGGLCLLFQGNEAAFLERFADEYRLSKKEKRLIELFIQHDGLHQRLSDAQWSRLYARPEWNDYLAAVATLRKAPIQFMRRHQQRVETLQFWIDQLKTKRFLISGDDLKALGVTPGARMGKLLEEAFDLSISLRITNKQHLLQRLPL